MVLVLHVFFLVFHLPSSTDITFKLDVHFCVDARMVADILSVAVNVSNLLLTEVGPRGLGICFYTKSMLSHPMLSQVAGARHS